MRLQVPVLKTERLVLEPLTLVHSVGMYQLWSRPEVCRYSGDAVDVSGHPIALPAKSMADSDKIIEFFGDRQPDGTGFRWAALIASEATFVGALGFNSRGHRPELAYHHHPNYWGLGLMSEACQATLSWAFAECGCDSVGAYVDARNEPSIRLLERLGLRSTLGVREGAVHYVGTRAVD